MSNAPTANPQPVATGNASPSRTTRSRFATATVIAFSAATLTACSAGSATDARPTPDGTSAADERAVGHVHGLGVDPADGTLYVASHYGVFRVDDDQPERVADRWQDTMGFTVVGPGRFLGSGHPDLTEDLPPLLGLIESTDAAETWDPVSLLGEADLHAIEAVGDYVYALDAATQSLVVTTDRQRWDNIFSAPFLDIASNPADPETVYATTTNGDLVRSVDQAAPVPVEGAPTLAVIDWQPDGPLVGVTPDGTVMVSADGATGWSEVGTLDGPAEALDVTPGRWHAATGTGVFESTDDGETWELVLAGDG